MHIQLESRELRPVQRQINVLYDEAKIDLPEAIVDPDQAEAWIAQRVLGLAERDHNRTRSLQAMLVSYIRHRNIWVNHPAGYDSLRDFLKDVGSDLEGNKLSASSISDFCAVAEIIDPFCRANDIPLTPLLNGKDWGKFRETIPTLRQYIEDEENPVPLVRQVLKDVKALPNRDAVRHKYREPRKDKDIVGDSIYIGDHVVVGLVVNQRDWAQFKAKLGRDVEWDLLLDRIENGAVLRLDNVDDHQTEASEDRS